MSSSTHHQPFYTHHQSQNMNSLSISSSYNQLPVMNDNGNQKRDNTTPQLGHRAGLPSSSSFTSSIKSSQSTTSLHSIAPRTISTNEMVNFNDKFIKKSRNSKTFTTIKKSPNFNSRNNYNQGQYNYPNQYQYQNSNQNLNQYQNQYQNQYPNPYPNQYANQYPVQYPRQKQQQPLYQSQHLNPYQHQHRAPNQPPNQPQNQYPSQHPSQHPNQRQSYSKHRHRSLNLDNYTSKSSDQVVDRRFVPNPNQPPNSRQMNPYPQSKPKNITSKGINAYQPDPRNNDQFYQNKNQKQNKSQNFQDQRLKQNYYRKNEPPNQPTRYANKSFSSQKLSESQSMEIPSIGFYQQPIETTNLENNSKETDSNEKGVEAFDTSIDSMDQTETLKLNLPEENEVERKVSNSGSFEFPNGEIFNVKNPNSNNKVVKPLSKNYQPESYVHSNNSNNTNNNVNHLNYLNQQTPSTEGSAKFSIHSKSTPSTVTSSSSTSLSKMHGTNDPSMFSPVTQITVNENDMESDSEQSFEDAVDVDNINNIGKPLPVLTRKLSQPVAKPTIIKKTETKKEVKKSKFGFFKKLFKVSSNSESLSSSTLNSMNKSSSSLSSNLKKSNSGFSFKKLSIIKRSSTNNSNLSLVSENKKMPSIVVHNNSSKTKFNENRDNTPTLEDEVKTLEGNRTFDTLHSEDIFQPLELKNIITNSTVGTDNFSFLTGDEKSKEIEEPEPEQQEVFKNSEYKLSLPELDKSKPEEFDFDYLSTVFGLGETSFFSTSNDKEIKNGDGDGMEELKRKKSVFKSIENKLSVRRLRSKSISIKSLKKFENNDHENGEEGGHLNEVEVEIYNEGNVLQNDRVSKVTKFTEIQQPNKSLKPLKGCLKNGHKNIFGHVNEDHLDNELEKDVKFSDKVLWSDSFSSKDYDRFNPDMKHVYCMLTYYPRQVRDIRIELNLYKEYEMEVNQFSRQYTHFFRT